MPAIPSGADALANTLLTTLLEGQDFSVPAIDLDDAIFNQPPSTGPIYEEIDRIVIADLTTGDPCGTGVFDKLMQSLTAHLKVEYDANRISGAEYTKAYVGVITAALQTSSQFLLAKDQAYWQALLVQAQAKAAEVDLITARVSLATAKVNAARAAYEAVTAEANYGLTKMKISTEDATYANMVRQGTGLDFTNEVILPLQEDLLSEQVEVQRAQTMNTRTDGVTPITGSVGKQKDLYTQQITSYQRDAENKAVKLFTDAWITQKTMDEGLLAPDQFTNTNVNEMLVNMRANLNMGS
jgi:hypothetical protein